MIRTVIKIKNPWSKNLPQKDYFYYHKTLGKNKSFELQIFESSMYNLFGFVLDLSWIGEDHAGPSLEIELWKYNINIKIYDHRHWDYDNGTWENDEPSNMEK